MYKCTAYSRYLKITIMYLMNSNHYNTFVIVSSITASILDAKKFPMGLAIAILLNGTAVFSTTISSAIESRIDAQPFFTYKMFAGVAYILATLVMLWLKFTINCKMMTKL